MWTQRWGQFVFDGVGGGGEVESGHKGRINPKSLKNYQWVILSLALSFICVCLSLFLPPPPPPSLSHVCFFQSLSVCSPSAESVAHLLISPSHQRLLSSPPPQPPKQHFIHLLPSSSDSDSLGSQHSVNHTGSPEESVIVAILSLSRTGLAFWPS